MDKASDAWNRRAQNPLAAPLRELVEAASNTVCASVLHEQIAAALAALESEG